MSIDLTQLPPPDVLDYPNFEALLSERKAALIAACPEAIRATIAATLELESEPLTIDLEQSVYREFILRERINTAVKAQGTTVIYNPAKEPHIVDLANFLNSMGANLKGAGTDTIRIFGVDKLHGGTYAIIPDQIEAGTYMAAVAACGGQVLVRGIIPKHMDCITAKLQEMGVQVEEQDDTLLVRRSGKLRRTNVKTLPYPGFPTDMQPQITVALCLAEGTSMVTEGVWDNRYRYVGELTRMGAQIRVEGRSAVIEGVDHLTAASVQAYDLRAGAAMVIAALAAEGTSEVSNVHYIERGYEDIIGKLRNLGAQIDSVECDETVETRQIG